MRNFNVIGLTGLGIKLFGENNIYWGGGGGPFILSRLSVPDQRESFKNYNNQF